MKKLTSYIFLYLLLTSTAFAKPHEQIWHPDTCNGCAVVQEFDDELPAEQRVVTFKRIEKHNTDLASPTDQEEYAKIVEENQRKNKVFNEIKKTNPDLKPDDFTYYFDSQRKLIVTADVSKMPAKSDLESVAGAGKVDVQ